MRWALILKGTNSTGHLWVDTLYYDTREEARAARRFYMRKRAVDVSTLVYLESAVLVDTGA